MAFTDLTQRNEHYRRRNWSIATSYNLLLPHCQRRHLPLPPSDNNQDDDSDKDDEDEDDSDNDNDFEEYYGLFDYNSDGNCRYNYGDLDHSDDDDDNDDDDDDDDDNDDNKTVYFEDGCLENNSDGNCFFNLFFQLR